MSWYRPSIQSRKVSVAVFAAVLKLNFGFSNLGERRPLSGWAFMVSDGVSVTSYRSHYKAIRCLLWFFCRV